MTTRPGSSRSPRSLRAREIALLAVATLVLTACGSTRYVLVENDAALGTTPAGTPASGPASAAPATSAPGAVASDAEQADIEAAVQSALTPDDRRFRDRLPALDGADDLGPTFEAVRKVVEGLKVQLVIDAVTVNGDEATATMSVVVDGGDFATGLPVTLVRKDGSWKVTRSGACTLLSLASPCPDAPGT